MSALTKNEAIIEALESAGYQEIRLKVIPKRFLFTDGQWETELEFSRNYFDNTTLAALQCLMQDQILPAVKQQLGKKVYVDARGISIIPSAHGREDKC